MKRRSILQALIAGIVAFFAPMKAALPALAEPKFTGYYGIREHENMFTMFWEIVRHAEATGDEILSSDNPMKLTVGYVAVSESGETNAEWSIRITRVKESRVADADIPLDWRTGPMAEAREQIAREYIKTVAGRAKLASSLTSAGRRFNRCRRSAWTEVQTSP